MGGLVSLSGRNKAYLLGLRERVRNTSGKNYSLQRYFWFIYFNVINAVSSLKAEMSILKTLNPAVLIRNSNKGTDSHIRMTFTSLLLALLVPIFVFTFGRVFGSTHEEVTSFLNKPFNYIVITSTLVISFIHFKQGVKVLIEDYVRGLTRTILLSFTSILSYGAILVILYSITKILI